MANQQLLPQIMTPPQRALFDALPPRLQLYVSAKLRGATSLEAYAETVPHSTATTKNKATSARRIDCRADVKAVMAAMAFGTATAAIMAREEAMEKLTILARTNMSDIVDFQNVIVGADADGKPVVQSAWVVKDSALMDKAQLAVISELTATSAGIKVKLHNPLAALQQLASMQGWDKPAKLDVTSSDGSMAPQGLAALDVSKLSSKVLHELLEVKDATPTTDNE